MPGSDLIAARKALANSLHELVGFAMDEEDYLLAAKLEDVRDHLITKYGLGEEA